MIRINTFVALMAILLQICFPFVFADIWYVILKFILCNALFYKSAIIYTKIVNISKFVLPMALKLLVTLVYAQGNTIMSKPENRWLQDCSGFLQIGSQLFLERVSSKVWEGNV